MSGCDLHLVLHSGVPKKKGNVYLPPTASNKPSRVNSYIIALFIFRRYNTIINRGKHPRHMASGFQRRSLLMSNRGKQIMMSDCVNVFTELAT